jgi:hypothetical protein
VRIKLVHDLGEVLSSVLDKGDEAGDCPAFALLGACD